MLYRRAHASTAFLFLALIVSGCGPKVGIDCLQHTDHWTRKPSVTIGDYAFADEAIRIKQFSPIMPAKLEDATALLTKAYIVEITPQQALDFAAKVPTDIEGRKPFLVRALSNRVSSGEYVVDYFRSEIWIRYIIHDPRVCKPDNYHEALIVWLPKEPEAVSITTSFAQG